MEQRLGNTWRMTVNEKNFIKTSLLSNIRVDARGPLDFRRLVIEFGGEDGSSDVQLGQTHVMGFVTSQLVQPYRDRPNEGSLSIYTEFSPMADPSFEPGRPTESAVELGRIIDHGLRESRAVDMESLCIVAGKLVWAIRVDLHIVDNSGNLVDAANIAALAALLTFRRPECTLGGDDQEVIIHPPEAKEPLPLLIHHIPIAVTFGFFDNGEVMIIDPTHYEEAVMEGRLTTTLNTNGDVCAIQKAGGVGVFKNNIISCLRFASVKAADITAMIRNAVESYNTERTVRKIKRHSSSAAIDVCEPCTNLENRIKSLDFEGVNDISLQRLEISIDTSQSNSLQGELNSHEGRGNGHSMIFEGGPSSWNPYSKGVNPDALKSSLASRGAQRPCKKVVGEGHKTKPEQHLDDVKQTPLRKDVMVQNEEPKKVQKTLKDAIKPKHKRKKKLSVT